MHNHNELVDGIEAAINNALHVDDEGDYNFSVPDAAEQVVDYLESIGLITFVNEN